MGKSIGSPFLGVDIDMLVKRFNLREIKEYEEDTGTSILDLFNDVLGDNSLIELIKLGNKNCDDRRASDILDLYLESGNNYSQAFLEIKECLLGKDIEEGEGGIDAKDYSSLTDIYNDLCMQLMSIGVSYGEFWNMTTKDMYRVFDSIKVKIQSDMQRQLNLNHTLAAMVGGAVWGKLDKEPPKVDFKDTKKEEVVDIEGLGEVDSQTLGNILALKSVTSKMKGGNK